MSYKAFDEITKQAARLGFRKVQSFNPKQWETLLRSPKPVGIANGLSFMPQTDMVYFSMGWEVSIGTKGMSVDEFLSL